jgi:DNA ligase D-like protein (predicted 3'-phosphoesterase)
VSATDFLAKYNAKRDFAKTAEPAGRPGRTTGNSFMVQKHAASRLHWDFRLELDGVLLSWAVTKAPSGDPSVKRLAVRTEDHPLGYATFEGTIPKGEYGGGTVMLWDRGTWENESDPRAGLEKGKLHFTLTGERMKGEWVLIRLKPEGKAENWLLGKIADAFATGADLDFDTSIETGRTMSEIAFTGMTARRRGGAGQRHPHSANPSSQPSSTRRRRATTGSTRRSTTAIARSSRSAAAGRSRIHGEGSTGPRSSAASPAPAPRCRAPPR